MGARERELVWRAPKGSGAAGRPRSGEAGGPGTHHIEIGAGYFAAVLGPLTRRRPKAIKALFLGPNSAVFKVDLSDGAPVAVKAVKETPWGVRTVANQAYMLRYLAAHSALPVPKVLHVDKTALVIEYVGKGNKHRAKRLPLYGEAGKLAFAARYHEDLEHYRRAVLPRRYRPAAGHEKALFLSQKRWRITVRQIERIFGELMRALGLGRAGYTPHSLRHGFARAKLDDGVGLRQLQRLLDHASIRTTEVYLDAEEEELTEAMGRGVPEERDES